MLLLQWICLPHSGQICACDDCTRVILQTLPYSEISNVPHRFERQYIFGKIINRNTHVHHPNSLSMIMSLNQYSFAHLNQRAITHVLKPVYIPIINPLLRFHKYFMLVSLKMFVCTCLQNVFRILV